MLYHGKNDDRGADGTELQDATGVEGVGSREGLYPSPVDYDVYRGAL